MHPLTHMARIIAVLFLVLLAVAMTSLIGFQAVECKPVAWRSVWQLIGLATVIMGIGFSAGRESKDPR